MNGEFKQCPNGHYYQGISCPYCKTDNPIGSKTQLKTEIFITEKDPTVTGYSDDTPTILDNPPYRGGYSGDENRTTIDNAHASTVPPSSKMFHNRTVFGDDEESIPNNRPNPLNTPNKGTRYGRKLVGWLVTYSSDELGIDFKLYEGRNIIGRDVDCNITVNDGRVSGKHAVLLFRANKYSITDSQSSHGTFVNDEDIELEPFYLKDGDIIRIGNTIFKFRTSL